MKSIVLLLVFGLINLIGHAQSCTFTHVQSMNKDTFALPTFSSSFTIDSISWNFGDGQDTTEYASSISSLMPHTYKLVGQYNVCLSVWLTEAGNPTQILCTSCDSISIICDAIFNFHQGSDDLSVVFNDSTYSVEIINEIWDFGDSSSLSNNPLHTYQVDGKHYVCHTINGVDNNGLPYSCSYCDSILIIPHCKTDIFVTLTDVSIHAESQSIAPGPAQTNYWVLSHQIGGIPIDWNYGWNYDYTFSGGLPNDSVILFFTLSGNSISGYPYTCKSKKTIKRNDLGKCEVISNFNYSINRFEITVNDLSAMNLYCNTYWATINFGDGSGNENMISRKITHQFEHPGTYNVCLSSNAFKLNASSDYDSKCIPITIQPACPIAEFKYLVSGMSCVFTDSTYYTNNCTSHIGDRFDFGDMSGISDTLFPGDKVNHLYKMGGTYKVCLISESHRTGEDAYYDTLCKYVVIDDSKLNQIIPTSAYPNPVRKFLTMSFPSNDIGVAQYISISDITGQILSNQMYIPDLNGEIRIDFSSFKRGVYFVFNNERNKERKRFKVVKE